MQEDHLIAFLKALRSNTFYGPLLESFADSSIESSPYDVLKKLPLSDKALLTENYHLIRNESYSGEQDYTGGSTGSPFHYVVGKKELSSLSGFTMSLWTLLGGYDWNDTTIVVGGTSIGDRRSIKKNILHLLQRRKFVSGSEINEANAELLAKTINKAIKPVFLYGYPSSICQYILMFKKNGISINPEKIKKVLVTSETLSEEKKHLMESFFRKPVVNLYGARDGGITAGSTDNKTFIYNGIDCVVESLEIHGVKELVLTNLDSEAFPFVRYRIGDMADVSIADEGYPFILSNLQGRTRDFIHLGANKKIHGSTINKVFKDTPVIEYQIIQHKDLRCDIHIQTREELNGQELSLLKEHLKSVLEDVPFEIFLDERLERQMNNKLKNIISEVEV